MCYLYSIGCNDGIETRYQDSVNWGSEINRNFQFFLSLCQVFHHCLKRRDLIYTSQNFQFSFNFLNIHLLDVRQTCKAINFLFTRHEAFHSFFLTSGNLISAYILSFNSKLIVMLFLAWWNRNETVDVWKLWWLFRSFCQEPKFLII